MNIASKMGQIIALLGAILLLVSCDRGGPSKDLQAYLTKVKSAEMTSSMSKADSTLRVATPIPPVQVKYEAASRRSPFETMASATTKNRVITNPLQTYPLDVLRFVGTVTQNAKTAAYIAAPDNRIYQVKVGDLIGEHDSKVLSIDPEKVTLMDKVAAEEGAAPVEHEVTLQLKESNQ